MYQKWVFSPSPARFHRPVRASRYPPAKAKQTGIKTVSRVREPVNTLLQHQTNHPTDALLCTSTSPATPRGCPSPHHRRFPTLPPLVPRPMAAPASTMPAKMRAAQYDAYGGGAAGLKVTNSARAAVHITLSSSPFPFSFLILLRDWSV
jgi:hypothetical protein